MDTPSPLPPLIQTREQLTGLCAALQTSPWLALDTEFMRERTYHPRLCLIQVATPETCACIDTLHLDATALAPFLELLADPAVTKVFHGASQDLEVLHALERRSLHPLFDTQVAAPLLGFRDQMGYGALVEALLGHRLPKGHTRTDWSRRPLSREQLAYAADDVIYLARLYPLMSNALQEKGRLHWLEEDFARLADSGRRAPDPARAWQRIRGGAGLRGRQLAALQALAAWREEEARRQNRPRGWLLRDEVLLELARTLPRSGEAIASLAQRHAAPTLARHRDTLLALLADLPEQAPAPAPDRQRLDAEEKALVDSLMERLRHRCRQAGIDPAAVCGRRELARLVQGERELRLLRGWRRHLAGAALLAWLESRA